MPVSEKEIFLQAIDLKAADRAAFISQACGEDRAMERGVRMLLEQHENNDTDLEFDKNISTILESCARKGSVVVGNFELFEELGRGAFGTVFRARQFKPVVREAAVKMLNPLRGSEEVIRRFEAERQSMALVDHPNVAHVYEAGTDAKGQLFLAMELIEGTTITQHSDDQILTIAERVQLFIEVCRAIHHTHQKGIIHRDLKPSNVLVATQQGMAIPKVIDFGVAKVINNSLANQPEITQAGQIIGSLAYMSPEQINSSESVDTRCDIYSLGVLLNELLIGDVPFSSTDLRQLTLTERSQMICLDDPKPPSIQLADAEDIEQVAARRRSQPGKLAAQLRGDLDWIVIKCLEKDPSRRYETVNDLIADLKRHLNHEPVSAGPPKLRYRVSKYVKRNRVGVLFGSLAVGAVVLGLIGTSLGMIWALNEKKHAEEEREQAVVARKRAEEVKDLVRTVFLNLGLQNEHEQFSPLFVGALKESEKLLETCETCETGDLHAKAEVSRIMSTAYFHLGSMDDAERHLVKNQKMLRELGVQDQVYLDSQYRLATIKQKSKKFEEAERIHLENLDAQTDVLGEDHFSVHKTLNALGTMYEAWGKTDESKFVNAKKYAKQAFESVTASLGPNHLKSVATQNNLALIYRRLGEEEEACFHYKESVEACRQTMGESHSLTLTVMDGYARCLLEFNRPQEALSLAREMCDVDEKTGYSHPPRLNVLAQALFETGNLDEAVEKQQVAYRLAGPNAKTEFKKNLDKYEEALKGEDGSK